PYFFKNQIMDKVKEEINKEVNARVDFKDFGLSLIRNFPHFSFHIDGITVIGVNEFNGDTLAEIHSFAVMIDLVSVIEGDLYRIRKILIDQPELTLLVNEDGKANWDIAKPADAMPEEPVADQTSDFVISLRKLEVVDARLVYIDRSSNTMVLVEGLRHTLNGDFSANNTKVNTSTLIKSITVTESGVNYLHNTMIEFKAILDADLKNEMYTFKKNSLKINELIFNFDGSAAMVNDDVNIMMTFKAPQNNFKSFLSLIPAIYTKDFEGIETSGKLAIDGYIKGTYNAQNIPSFRLNVLVDDAMFKYPDLPYPVEGIMIRAQVLNPGGDINNTSIDVEKFYFKILRNPVDIRISLNNLMEDPYIDGEVKGLLDLSVIKSVYPLEEGEDLQGKITMNVATKGNLSSIENEQYDEFTAIGSVLVQGLKYQSNEYTGGLLIQNAQLNFSPSYLDLVGLQFNYLESDMKASGRIDQYLGYALGDKTLTGTFTTNSEYFNVSNFMAEEETGTGSTASEAPGDLSAIKVPEKIDFKLSSSFTKLLYDNILLKNVKGTILVKDETVFLDKLHADLYEGTLEINGTYTTLDRDNPLVDVDLSLKEISITDAYASFDIMEKLAPVAEHTFGKFSTDMKFTTDLDQEMMPVLATFLGNGALHTSSISVEGVKGLNMLSNTLKIDQFKQLDLNPLDILFTIAEGKVNVKPFELKSNNIKANVSGWTAFDQSIDYVMQLEVPKSLFGSAANNALDDLLSKANVAGANFSVGETIDLDVLFTGTITDPMISTSLANLGQNLIEDTRKQLEEELRKKQEEAKKKASEEAQKILDDADKQAKKILAEAQVKADEIKKAARNAAGQVRAEANKQGDNIMKEARGKGTLAEIGAKKTADEVKKEGDKQANNLVAEANKQADNIMNQARNQASQVKTDAQKRVDEMK
ncbi:MAG: AsmA-like C-terminal region-containing protein, partial [Bacteroidota bacterium]|nr:AsmA-like C-terminal region-containing protein [Bacteroidota bacterium]